MLFQLFIPQVKKKTFLTFGWVPLNRTLRSGLPMTLFPGEWAAPQTPPGSLRSGLRTTSFAGGTLRTPSGPLWLSIISMVSGHHSGGNTPPKPQRDRYIETVYFDLLWALQMQPSKLRQTSTRSYCPCHIQNVLGDRDSRLHAEVPVWATFRINVFVSKYPILT
jgi:hypothetical protein